MSPAAVFGNHPPLIGLFRFLPPDVALEAALAAARGGVRALEVTMNSPEPERLIEEIGREVEGVVVGAGTVMSVEEVERALAAGARFIVSPHLDEELVGYCARASVPVFPGATTPTEVWRAHQAGATMVKLFPAGPLGAEYVRALQGPFPQIDLLVTGGIDSDNLGHFLGGGARGAAVGGRLFPADALQRGDFSAVEGEARKLAAVFQEYWPAAPTPRD